MGRTDLPQADPLISPIASFLNVPFQQLYALLWRAGVLEIVEAQAAGKAAGDAEEVLAAPDRQRHG
ncbi:Rv1535 domain-containing protein [Mycobacterium conspicuum]|uniref:Rv1535 domain-containing protein n=1 Tax=Mycobacterium conspicuum TaxID=44010 RepID=UPI002011708F|nr:Rv1535 domain-containing protein [Mycobacterium conspicuum]